METKNLLALLPSCSPVKHQRIVDLDSTSMITMSPMMTRYSKTTKQLSLAKEEDVGNAEEKKEEIRINTTFSRTNHCDLLKECCDYESD